MVFKHTPLSDSLAIWNQVCDAYRLCYCFNVRRPLPVLSLIMTLPILQPQNFVTQRLTVDLLTSLSPSIPFTLQWSSRSHFSAVKNSITSRWSTLLKMFWMGTRTCACKIKNDTFECYQARCYSSFQSQATCMSTLPFSLPSYFVHKSLKHCVDLWNKNLLANFRETVFLSRDCKLQWVYLLSICFLKMSGSRIF